MSKKVILFDLDGTLLPMDQDIFVKHYFGGLAKKLAPYGYEPEKLIQAVWQGTGAMVKNDGSKTNEKAFWELFETIFGERVQDDKPIFEDFYANEFQKVRDVCGFNPKAADMIHQLKDAGFRLVLATNPLFPAIATESRMRWAGLSIEDFELYTTYEDNNYCKPNPKYYLDIVNKLGVQPEDCIMVGNDVSEDMVAESIGMEVFLITDCLINKEEKDISVYPNGGMDEALAFLIEKK